MFCPNCSQQRWRLLHYSLPNSCILWCRLPCDGNHVRTFHLLDQNMLACIQRNNSQKRKRRVSSSWSQLPSDSITRRGASKTSDNHFAMRKLTMCPMCIVALLGPRSILKTLRFSRAYSRSLQDPDVRRQFACRRSSEAHVKWRSWIVQAKYRR